MPSLPPPKNNASASSVASLTSSSSFSSYSSTSTSSSTSMDRQPLDLIDQLKNSPETRFHAAWLFLRFFYLTMSPDRNTGNNARNISRQSSMNSNTSGSTNQEGRDLIIWDIAIACLALSVKVIVFLALCLLLIRVTTLSSSSAIFCTLYFPCTRVNILRWPLSVYLTRIWRYRPS
jgi:hypothetical protein